MVEEKNVRASPAGGGATPTEGKSGPARIRIPNIVEREIALILRHYVDTIKDFYGIGINEVYELKRIREVIEKIARDASDPVRYFLYITQGVELWDDIIIPSESYILSNIPSIVSFIYDVVSGKRSVHDNITIRTIEINPQMYNEIKYTALHLTGIFNMPETAKFLLEKGAKLYSRAVEVSISGKQEDYNSTYTVLHLAARYDALDAMKVYIEDFNGDVNIKSNEGKTPLHLVKTVRMAEYLMSHGANINAKDKNNDTPFNYAVRSENLALVNFYVNNTNLSVSTLASGLFTASNWVFRPFGMCILRIIGTKMKEKVSDSKELTRLVVPAFKRVIREKNLEAVKYFVEELGIDLYTVSKYFDPAAMALKMRWREGYFYLYNRIKPNHIDRATLFKLISHCNCEFLRSIAEIIKQEKIDWCKRDSGSKTLMDYWFKNNCGECPEITEFFRKKKEECDRKYVAEAAKSLLESGIIVIRDKDGNIIDPETIYKEIMEADREKLKRYAQAFTPWAAAIWRY